MGERAAALEWVVAADFAIVDLAEAAAAGSYFDYPWATANGGHRASNRGRTYSADG